MLWKRVIKRETELKSESWLVNRIRIIIIELRNWKYLERNIKFEFEYK